MKKDKGIVRDEVEYIECGVCKKRKLEKRLNGNVLRLSGACVNSNWKRWRSRPDRSVKRKPAASRKPRQHVQEKHRC